MKNSESKEVHQEILSWFKKKNICFSHIYIKQVSHQLTVA